VFSGRELLASHVDEGQAQHEGDQGVVGVLLERRHVLAQRILQNIRKIKITNTVKMQNFEITT
jgi:hypothetical protein